MRTTTLLAILTAALTAAAAGCDTEAFCFSCESGTGGGTTGAGGASTGSNTGGAGGDGNTIFANGGGGNGSGTGGNGTGGGCDADTQNDPKNCGACGNVCDLLGAFPKCVAGQCAIDSCAPGHVDKNKIETDGCEYACSPSNGGVEACDDLDNDCDGEVDEDFNLDSDPNNCGTCGFACALPNATADCAPVGGFPSCVVKSCDAGYGDVDGLDDDGCEYACPVFPTEAEVCNDKDDNCDGVINEGNPGGGVPCESTCPNGVCQGECTPGTTLCAGTQLVCVPGKGPSLEACDGKDNDCDGVVDNGYDLQNDPQNCGACGKSCNLPNAVAACQSGQCVIGSCLPGFASNDKDASNGCEYTCPVSPKAVESCNGVDDDCNGIVDDAVAIAPQKPPAALCQPKPGTPCAGADFACTGATGWRCTYGAGVEVDGNGKLAIVETKCDGVDGNCNGQVDEAFGDLGTDCDNGQLGACRDAGERVCDPNDTSKTKCDFSVLPDPTPGAPTAEVCNGIDDDCDGQVDDGIVDDMVLVQSGNLKFLMDRYEASRPDATSNSAGLVEARRCVTADVIPWTFATQAEAAAACAATGARLCTDAEMQAACEGPNKTAYPYGASYQPLTCNGLDYDGVPGGANDNVLLPTGAQGLAACASSYGIRDLSGNAVEWTSTVTGNTGAPKNLPIYMAKGGSYQTPASGLTCQFTLSRFASNAILPELGFRCCKTAP